MLLRYSDLTYSYPDFYIFPSKLLFSCHATGFYKPKYIIYYSCICCTGSTIIAFLLKLHVVTDAIKKYLLNIIKLVFAHNFINKGDNVPVVVGAQQVLIHAVFFCHITRLLLIGYTRHLYIFQNVDILHIRTG